MDKQKIVIKYMCIFIVIIVLLLTILMIFKQLYEKQKKEDLSSLCTFLDSYDYNNAKNILEKYNRDKEFEKTASTRILEITDEEISNLSNHNLNYLIDLLKYLKTYTFNSRISEINSMYTKLDTYISLKNTDDIIDYYIKKYGYIYTDKYLTSIYNQCKYQYEDSSLLLDEIISQRKEIQEEVIQEVISKSKEHIKNNELEAALELLEYCSSWENEEINQLYTNVKNKVPQKNNSNNIIEKGMSQQEVLEICGEPDYISNESNIKDKNKGYFGNHDAFWYYSIKKSNKYLKFGVYFWKGKVVGISKTNPDTKLSEPVSILLVD